jgi:hypothetical protein
MSANNVVERLDDPYRERYRVLKWGQENYGLRERDGIRYGYLAQGGEELLRDMAVLSSMSTGSFHSGERLKALMGDPALKIDAERQDDERSVTQAFTEVYGRPFILPNLTWHRWLSDGELNEVQFSGRRGDFLGLGPTHAHTIAAGPPARLRDMLVRLRRMSTDAVNARIEEFLDGIDAHLLDDEAAEIVKSYHAARAVHRALSTSGRSIDPRVLDGLFADAELEEAFGVAPADELITYTSVNGNKARSKYSPATNVQAMMTYELMRAGWSCAFWIESRDIRKFDTHHARRRLWKDDGVSPVGLPDTTERMNRDLWRPLLALVERLKSTEWGDTGRSLYDLTTIVLTSEFGRSMHGDVEAIRKKKIADSEKNKMIGEQDICQHWPVTSAAFLGGSVRGGSQFGRVGEETLRPVPILPDGSLDPAFHAESGLPREGSKKSDRSFVPGHGDVYATALHLADIDPTGRGRNRRQPLRFIKRT